MMMMVRTRRDPLNCGLCMFDVAGREGRTLISGGRHIASLLDRESGHLRRRKARGRE
jgi:hypothetical protein